MIFITGDKHGNFDNVFNFFRHKVTNTSQEKDYLIILGDAGINYFLNGNDTDLKRKLAKLPVTLICVHGNHEERPERLSSYRKVLYSRIKEFSNKEFKHKYSADLEGWFYVEEEFPNILFPAIGQSFSINDKEFFHLGGAYSVDKHYRLQKQAEGKKYYKWFESEQLTSQEKDKIREKIMHLPKDVIILSHTCPKKYIPFEKSLVFKADTAMEIFLDEFENKVCYEKWYCGHWHINHKIDKIHFLYEDIIEVE